MERGEYSQLSLASSLRLVCSGLWPYSEPTLSGWNRNDLTLRVISSMHPHLTSAYRNTALHGLALYHHYRSRKQKISYT